MPKIPLRRICSQHHASQPSSGSPVNLEYSVRAEIASESRSLGVSVEFSSGISITLGCSVRVDIRSSSYSGGESGDFSRGLLLFRWNPLERSDTLLRPLVRFSKDPTVGSAPRSFTILWSRLVSSLYFSSSSSSGGPSLLGGWRISEKRVIPLPAREGQYQRKLSQMMTTRQMLVKIHIPTIQIDLPQEKASSTVGMTQGDQMKLDQLLPSILCFGSASRLTKARPIPIRHCILMATHGIWRFLSR
jgi:hypothetical protein